MSPEELADALLKKFVEEGAFNAQDDLRALARASAAVGWDEGFECSEESSPYRENPYDQEATE